MSEHTYKLVELVGSSTTSSDEAIRNAIVKASATIKHIDWFQVIEIARPRQGRRGRPLPGHAEGRLPDRGVMPGPAPR